MAEYRKLWWLLIATLGITFSLLGYFGNENFREAPPIPGVVQHKAGGIIMTRGTLLGGQTA